MQNREGYAHGPDGLAPLLLDKDLLIANREGPIPARSTSPGKISISR
jgi:hypothetical protein